MADTSNGLIFGLAQVMFAPDQGEEVELGWISEEGLSPSGSAASFTDIYAAQVTDGPVDSIMSNPGSDAFDMTLIQLKADNLSKIFGGKAEADGSWTPPSSFVKTGVVTFKAHSGHSMRIFKARVSKSQFQNGLNMNNVMGIGINVQMLKDADKERRFRIYPPGVVPDTADDTADGAGG